MDDTLNKGGLDPREPAPYGIGSLHWPGVGKVIEEQNELGVVFGKLFGSGGARHHWSGDLVAMMQDEIADSYAALDFLLEVNPLIHEGAGWASGHLYTQARRRWKLDLFRSWHRGDTADQWPQPEAYGLPPREKPAALRAQAGEKS